MKSFGRLLMAAALIVPVGVATAQHVGAATPSDNAACTAAGTLKASPGLRLTVQQGQTFTTPGSTVSGCTGIGIDAETGGTLGVNVQRTAANCKTMSRRLFVGSGQIKWDSDGANAGITTKMKLNFQFVSLRTIKVTGTVTSTYLHGAKVASIIVLAEARLRSAGDGDGKCVNGKKLKLLGAWTAESFTLG
jgi:hypothetical protein